jgi:hypothetical protein
MSRDEANLFKILCEYNEWEAEKVRKQVADGGPEPVNHPFTLVGLYHYLDSKDIVTPTTESEQVS